MSQSVYLDYAAATPLDKDVLKAMQPFFSDKFYNPSASYSNARQIRQEIADARATVASHLGAKPTEIVFTAGGSEANNLAIQGVMNLYPDANLLVSAVEHDSVLKPAELYDHRLLPVQPDGRVNIDDLEQLIDDKTVLVSVMYANNEIGTVEPISKIGQLINKIRQERRASKNALPLYFHSDAAQATNYLDLHVSRLGVDLMTINGGKIYGPKQSGCLFIRSGVSLKPLILGGGQELGLRNGTENVASIIGFACALDKAQSARKEEGARLAAIQSNFYKTVADALPNASINGSIKHRLPNNLQITLPGQDNERLVVQLDEAGFDVAVGSACSASSEEPSHVLKAIGLSRPAISASLRITMGRSTTQTDIDRLVSTLKTLVA